MTLNVKLDGEKYSNDFRRDGYFVCEDVLGQNEIQQLKIELGGISGTEVRRKRSVYGIRNLLEISPAVCELAADDRIRQFATSVLGDNAFAVRGIFFDKVADANWSLFWHQDNVIAVQDKVETEGFVAWSQKSGVWQVQPPVEVLSKVVTVRLHLDDCDETNGPLRVLPGSHRHGWLDDELDDWKEQVSEVVCSVRSGGVVTMCPLTLHASSASENAKHRRVIHLEYAAEELPGSLEWNNRIGPHQVLA